MFLKKLLLFLAGIVSLVAIAQDGSPDESFGTNGVVITDIGLEGLKWITGLDDGVNNKVFISGYNENINLNEITNFIIAYLEDGSIDTSFGDDGFIFWDGTNESNISIYILPDEKMLIKSTINNECTIKRLLPNGSLDTSFGNNGQIQPFISGGLCHRMILNSDIDILIYGIDTSPNEPIVIVKKYTNNGILDVAFGINGMVSYSFGDVSEFSASTFALKNDNLYLGINFKENNISTKNIFKLLLNGDIDPTFGNDGLASIPFEQEFHTNFTIFQDESLLVSGNYYDLNTDTTIRKLIKLFPDASVNESFGNNGSIAGFEVVYIQENQRFIANSDFYDFEGGLILSYTRFFPGGTIDNSFQFSSNYSELNSTFFKSLSSGKLLVASSDIWYNGPPINIVLQRFNNNPLGVTEFQNSKITVSPNPSNGIFNVNFDLFSEKSSYQITDSTGKIIASGVFNDKQTQIDLSAVQSGVYFLKTGNSVLRLLKN